MFNGDSTFNREIAICCDCSVQTQRNNKIFSIFNDKMVEKRLKTVCFSNEQGYSIISLHEFGQKSIYFPIFFQSVHLIETVRLIENMLSFKIVVYI